MADMQKWYAKKAEQKKHLYEKYGKPFEKHHKGEYLAISNDGQTIIGDMMGEVLHEAVEIFGHDNFAMARVGYPTLARWLRGTV
jgi:hypothetical protein